MSFLTLGRTAVVRQADLMTTKTTNTPEPNALAFTWSHVQDAPIRELFPGIRLRPLWRGDDGATAHVLEMDPNTCWQGTDVHEPGPEEVFVLSGTFNDGHRDYPAGTFIHCPAGSSHVPQTTTGCTLFVLYPEG
ncbi:anti-sigma factor [Kitasatospora acidiphila]|uniref:Anti-sigma factor n=2 Tax=Kitasatospora acidiphila TaxID=2567942 RepID=A0A540W5Z5_9ACTN|nr:anti-sigma factor [Kitasatospora acidiphila]